MTRALIFDLDGTLTKSKAPLEPGMGQQLSVLLRHMPVAVMSGGSYAQFQKQLLSGFPVHTDFNRLYLFPTSAAQCYGWKDGTWSPLYSHPFTPEEKGQVRSALHAALHQTGLATPPPQLWGEQIEDRGAQITWSALGQEAPVEMKQAWDPDRTKRAPLENQSVRRAEIL
jgi:phosphomannomutase